MNRSPTVAIAYLIEHGELDPKAAWDHVHAQRQVMPLRGALQAWLGRR
jgi:protein-tyrosine phosphatase